jgi:hypothetical protein
MPRLFFPRLLGNRGTGSGIPGTPTLSAARLSATAAQLTIGSDAGASNQVYYLQIGTAATVTGPLLIGPGSVNVTGLNAGSSYLFWVASSNGVSYAPPAFAFLSLTAADTILSAFITKWNGSATLVSLGGTLFANEVPETLGTTPVTPPYAVAVVGKSAFDWTSEKQYIEYATVSLCCYALGAANAEAVAAELHAEFDWQTLPFISSTPLYCRPSDYSVSNSFVRYKTGEVIYHVETTYEVAVLRTLAG